MNILLLGRAPRTPRVRRLLTEGVRRALGRAAARRGELCVVFASDAEMRRLNKRHLRRDRTTDVIAFRYEDPGPIPSGELPPFGDVYVGAAAAQRQARALGHSLLEEQLTLAVHGGLHLVGHDDGNPSAKKRMFARQDRLVRALMSGHGPKAPRR